MVIRLLRETDAEAYRDVRLRALQESPEAFGSSYEEETQWTVAQFAEKLAVTPERWMLGAFDGKGKLVGVIGWYRGARLKIRHKSHIVAVYVEPEHRGKGIAKQLLSQAIDRVRTETDIEQRAESGRGLCRFMPYGFAYRKISVSKSGSGASMERRLNRFFLEFSKSLCHVSQLGQQ
ncbi:ribosomal protein S18 acetylase RimI-like enzyme [Laceyella sediminis]|uniref:Ribosomal protein S18 acetylase RimI-like enzyme n=1 Tax=Laceyella sediminis TaxID=573074 RepID=A0ABX5EL22_9BACL|nr:GNAT family N-acetyltransferase [Laceyella sediminis]PRZ12629.1 ribosomal protein S18 acetylase RimI-like enzyme [Laceyella sediminis]